MIQRISLFVLAATLSLAAYAADAPGVVAKIGDTTLTQDQMEKELGMSLYEAQNNVYMIQKNWIDQKAKQILFDQAAKDAKMSRAEWDSKEITSHIAMPNEDEIQNMLRSFANQLPNPNKDPKIEEQHRQMVTGNLVNQRRNQREDEVLQELKKKYPYEVALLKPVAPHVEVSYAPDDPAKGPKDAPVTILEFTDFQCPYCKNSQATLKQVEEAYKGKVKLVERQYPLPFHNRAKPAARAALCSKEQGKFWDMHDKLFPSTSLEDADFKRFAKEIGLNEKKFDACMNPPNGVPTNDPIMARIDKDIADGQKFGVRGTPAFFVNGTMINGAQPYSVFDDTIKDALNKKS
jgi:protein-disulfide isomerase